MHTMREVTVYALTAQVLIQQLDSATREWVEIIKPEHTIWRRVIGMDAAFAVQSSHEELGGV